MLACRYPIYTCIGMQERDLSWQSSYKLWPSGVCHRIVAIGEALNVAQWANVTGGFADRWTYASDSFDGRSWERVANDEMWHSKYDSAIVIIDAMKSFARCLCGRIMLRVVLSWVTSQQTTV